MSLGTTIYTWYCGNLVGEDEFGNKYYCNIKDFEETKAKRWVIFKGSIEATKVPPHWHAWLHKSVDNPPINYKHKYFNYLLFFLVILSFFSQKFFGILINK